MSQNRRRSAKKFAVAQVTEEGRAITALTHKGTQRHREREKEEEEKEVTHTHTHAHTHTHIHVGHTSHQRYLRVSAR